MTPIRSAPSRATETPRFTLPRTSPAMYAEYWKPMNCRNTIPSMNGNTVRENRSPRKSCVWPGRMELPDAAIFCAETPCVYCGRLCWKSEWLVASSPNTNMSTKLATPIAAMVVTTLWNRARRQKHDAGDHREHDERPDQARSSR